MKNSLRRYGESIGASLLGGVLSLIGFALVVLSIGVACVGLAALIVKWFVRCAKGIRIYAKQ